MNATGEPNGITAVRLVQPWEEEADYWIPLLYQELQNGKARFGWGWEDDQDLRKIQSRIGTKGWEVLSDSEKEAWSHARFFLDVPPLDFLVYINMPPMGSARW
jgi:hypothetical protein